MRLPSRHGPKWTVSSRSRRAVGSPIGRRRGEQCGRRGTVGARGIRRREGRHRDPRPQRPWGEGGPELSGREITRHAVRVLGHRGSLGRNRGTAGAAQGPLGPTGPGRTPLRRRGPGKGQESSSCISLGTRTRGLDGQRRSIEPADFGDRVAFCSAWARAIDRSIGIPCGRWGAVPASGGWFGP